MENLDISNNLIREKLKSIGGTGKYLYLKKGDGSLASHFHGETEFSKKRKQKIIEEQEAREKKGYN